MKTDYEHIQKQICGLLEWDDGQYANHVYETGLAYIRCLPGMDELMAIKLESSAIFWNWFKLYRAALDKSIIDEQAIERLSLQRRIALYEAIHLPEALALEIKPNRVVWESVAPARLRPFDKLRAHKLRGQLTVGDKEARV